jgi:hypothetical protein
MVDLDAVGVDGPPGRGRQFDVVVLSQCQGDVTGALDETGVLLVRGEGAARAAGVSEPVVVPVLPLGDEPFVQKLLDLQHRPQGLVLEVPSAMLGRAAQVAGKELAEQRGHRFERSLDVGLLRR